MSKQSKGERIREAYKKALSTFMLLHLSEKEESGQPRPTVKPFWDSSSIALCHDAGCQPVESCMLSEVPPWRAVTAPPTVDE